MKLTARFVETVKPESTKRSYGDGRGGHGLRLRVLPSGAKDWVQRVRIRNSPTNIGLGPYPVVTLSEARKQALANRRVAHRGEDPRRASLRVEQALIECGRARNASAAWPRRVELHAGAILRKRIDAVMTDDAMAVLKPIWNEKRDTARQVKQRLSGAMRWAVAHKHREDDPFGHVIDAALPTNGYKQTHHKALPHAQVRDALQTIDATTAHVGTKLAFRFLVLTATRSGEVRGATWAEIDFDSETWTIPAERIKMDRGHWVPLSRAALDVLEEAKRYADGTGIVFPSVRGIEMSDSTLSKLLRENAIDAVPHGFRSSFRDWCAEVAHAPRELAEQALAHVEGNAVVAAYARSDMLERRRDLMGQWADYVKKTGDQQCG